MSHGFPPPGEGYGASIATKVVSECPPHQQVTIRYSFCEEESIIIARNMRTPPLRSYQGHTPEIRKRNLIRARQNYTSTSSRTSGDEMYSRHASPRLGPIYSPALSESHIFGGPSMNDEEAAVQIELWFRLTRRRHDQLAGRILSDLINRDTPLEDYSLHNLKLAADKIIFNGKLGDRVSWRWSKSSETQYEKELLGTTALREAPSIGSFETLIVLSKPLLRDKQYNRDLLLSAFLHELIHSYLFIQCGLGHAKDDGHTVGFQKIAAIINDWILQVNGHQRLHLCNMRANLDNFRIRNRNHCGIRHKKQRYQRNTNGCQSPEYVVLQEEMHCGRGAF